MDDADPIQFILVAECAGFAAPAVAGQVFFELLVGDDTVDQGELTKRVKQLMSTNVNAEVVVQADRRLKYKDVKKVMDVVERAGARRLALGTAIDKKEGG